MNLDINTDPEYWKQQAYLLAMNRTFQIVVIIFFVALAPRLMFMEHDIWQDEGRAMTTARNVLQGEGFHFHHDNPMNQHPPGFYLLLAAAFTLFGATDTVATSLVVILGALTAVFAYLLGKELYNQYAGIAAAAFMIFSPQQFFYSHLVLNDVPLAFFMTLAAYLFIKSERRENAKLFYAAIVATAMAALVKLPGLVLLPVFAVYLFYKRGWDMFHIRRYWYGAGILAAPFVLWEAYNIIFVGESTILSIGKRALIDHSDTKGALQRDTSVFYYVWNLPRIIGMPVTLLFIAGLASTALFDVKSQVDRFDTRAQYLVVGAFLAVTVAAFVALPFTRAFSVLLFFIGLTAVIFFVDTDSAFLLILLLAIFEMYTIKTTNIDRYFIPFTPFAAVMAGYGTDGIRRGVTSITSKKGGAIVFAVITGAILYSMYAPAVAQAQSASGGFAGLDDAGSWLGERVGEDETIMAASPNQIAWYSDHDNIQEAYRVSDQKELDAFVREHNVSYIEWDVWEQLMRSKAQYAPMYYEQSPNYERVKIFGPIQQTRNGQQIPSIMVYKVVGGEK